MPAKGTSFLTCNFQHLNLSNEPKVVLTQKPFQEIPLPKASTKTSAAPYHERRCDLLWYIGRGKTPPGMPISVRKAKSESALPPSCAGKPGNLFPLPERSEGGFSPSRFLKKSFYSAQRANSHGKDVSRRGQLPSPCAGKGNHQE